MKKKYYLYTLSNPHTNEIRYVGKTNNIERRYKEHINDTLVTYKQRWIQKLLKSGLHPKIEVLEVFTCENTCFMFEEYWIEQFKYWNFSLTNSTKGGRGGFSSKFGGEDNYNAVFSNKEALKVKSLLLNTGLSIEEIAFEMKTKPHNINNLKTGITYSKITGFTKGKIWTRKASIEKRTQALKDKGVYERASKKVLVIDSNLVYSSVSECARCLEVSRSTVIKYIKTGKLLKGLKLSYYEEN